MKPPQTPVNQGTHDEAADRASIERWETDGGRTPPERPRVLGLDVGERLPRYSSLEEREVAPSDEGSSRPRGPIQGSVTTSIARGRRPDAVALLEPP